MQVTGGVSIFFFQSKVFELVPLHLTAVTPFKHFNQTFAVAADLVELHMYLVDVFLELAC
jgi:hypothetical protein